MVKRILGTGTTDSNGVATLNYTGVGAGKVDVSASCTVDSSTIVSQPVAVWDTIKYDKGILDDPLTHDIWGSFRATLTRYSEYSAVTEATSGADGALYTSCPANTIFESDIWIGQSKARYYIELSNGSSILWGENLQDIYSSATIETWYHLKLEIGTSTITTTLMDMNGTVLGTNTKEYTNPLSAQDIQFSTRQGIEEIRFKNVKIYYA